MEVGKFKKEKEAISQELWELCEGNQCVDYKRTGLQARLQRVDRERNRYADDVNRDQSGVGALQELVAKDMSALQKHLNYH